MQSIKRLLSEFSKNGRFDFYFQQGRKFGVSISLVSSAPVEKLNDAKSDYEYQEIVKRYPSEINITHEPK